MPVRNLPVVSRWLPSAIKRNNLNLQFLSYESGNVIAAIAGAGGIGTLIQDLEQVRQAADGPMALWQMGRSMAAGYPELTIVTSIVCVALVAPLLRTRITRVIKGPAQRSVGMGLDILLTCVALAILIYSLTRDTAPIACAAAAFVVSSALFRQAADRPVFLKLGASALVLGGVFLALVGIDEFSGDHGHNALLGILTSLTGASVVLASLLAYEGGVHACRAAPEARGPMNEMWDWLFHSRSGLISQGLSAFVDGPVMWLNRVAQATVLQPIPREIRAAYPFVTAMWVRLPWRIATCGAAMASGAWAFAAANVAWAMGDVSLASIDWDDP